MITKDNYEVYAIDYLEGTLDSRLSHQFDLFLSAHPEIADQMDGLLDFRLTPDTWTDEDTNRLLHPVSTPASYPRYLWIVILCLVIGGSVWYISRPDSEEGMDVQTEDQHSTSSVLPVATNSETSSTSTSVQHEQSTTDGIESLDVSASDDPSANHVTFADEHSSSIEPRTMDDQRRDDAQDQLTNPPSDIHPAVVDATYKAPMDHHHVSMPEHIAVTTSDHEDITDLEPSSSAHQPHSHQKPSVHTASRIDLEPVVPLTLGYAVALVHDTRQLKVPPLKHIDIHLPDAPSEPQKVNNRKGRGLLAALLPTSIAINPDLKEALIPEGLSIRSD